eukprot:TRINITY_DN5686_c0_g1_i2.p1 TRINITY_DN5686_c0_g1~~TRINITY_DN5686_c0_g1_i2.p1  ORF type:complete len:116 (-),score=11.14 TRINITY_DN5686_c0_g1_i2:36-359(-)
MLEVHVHVQKEENPPLMSIVGFVTPEAAAQLKASNTPTADKLVLFNLHPSKDAKAAIPVSLPVERLSVLQFTGDKYCYCYAAPKHLVPSTVYSEFMEEPRSIFVSDV